MKLWFRRRWCTFGHRPPWIVDDRYEWVWVYIAIAPQSGACCCLLLPHVDTICLNLFLETVREEWPDERIGVVLDGSGSHRSEKVTWPKGIVPLPLPPYSPELNPVENLWHYLRAHYWSHGVYPDYDALLEVATETWRTVCMNPEKVRTICAAPYLERRT